MAETYRADIIVSDMKRLVRRLNEIEPELSKTMRREWKERRCRVKEWCRGRRDGLGIGR